MISKVAQRRLALHATQRELAHAAEVSLQYVKLIEGGYAPGAAVQSRIAKALDTTVEALWDYGAPETMVVVHGVELRRAELTPESTEPSVVELRKQDAETLAEVHERRTDMKKRGLTP